jgi:elongation factor Ts
MAAVTAAMVKELRELSGAGMAACKNALVEADGDIKRASEILREKGLASAAKKAGRTAAEGLVLVTLAEDRQKGVIVEVNIETDFAAKSDIFINYVEQIAAQALASNSKTNEEFAAEPWIEDKSITVGEALTQKIARIGENISIRRFHVNEMKANGAMVEYIHGGGKVGVVVELCSEVVNNALITAGRDICMQIAAMSPKFVSREEVSEDFITKEREILTQQALNEGKPQNIAEKMVEGRLNKSLKEFCLLDQEYVKDSELTVAAYVKAVGKEIGADITVKSFVRFETGEGIEKKEENFAEEVNKAMQG